jgi:hypothetical protein
MFISERPFSQAAAREVPRRTVQCVDVLSDARVKLEAFTNILIKGGRPVSTGILMPSSHVELSGSRKSSGKMQLPIKNWHSQLNYLS